MSINQNENSFQVRQLEDSILRAKADEVPTHAIDSIDIQNEIEGMVKAMQQAGGIGIAAPQVGISKRFFAIEIPEYFRVEFGNIPKFPLTVFINPEIIESSEEKMYAYEGCLSITASNGGHYEGLVERPIQITMRALNQEGKSFTIKAEGMLARALQHELDHLDGILFVDLVKRQKDLRIVYPKVEKDDPVFSHNKFLE